MSYSCQVKQERHTLHVALPIEHYNCTHVSSDWVTCTMHVTMTCPRSDQYSDQWPRSHGPSQTMSVASFPRHYSTCPGHSRCLSALCSRPHPRTGHLYSTVQCTGPVAPAIVRHSLLIAALLLHFLMPWVQHKRRGRIESPHERTKTL